MVSPSAQAIDPLGTPGGQDLGSGGMGVGRWQSPGVL